MHIEEIVFYVNGKEIESLFNFKSDQTATHLYRCRTIYNYDTSLKQQGG
jgi:hypothetical protein